MSSNEATTYGGLSMRGWVGVAIAVFSILFIFVNWDVTPISFIFFKVTMPLTIALALTFVGGMATGALIMRRRTRS